MTAQKLVRGTRFLLDFDWDTKGVEKEISSDFKKADEIMAFIERIPCDFEFQKLFHDFIVARRAICKSLAERQPFEDRDKLIEFLRGIKDAPPINGCDYRPFSLRRFKEYWGTEIDATIYEHERKLYFFYRPKHPRKLRMTVAQ